MIMTQWLRQLFCLKRYKEVYHLKCHMEFSLDLKHLFRTNFFKVYQIWDEYRFWHGLKQRNQIWKMKYRLSISVLNVILSALDILNQNIIWCFKFILIAIKLFFLFYLQKAKHHHDIIFWYGLYDCGHFWMKLLLEK